MGFCAKVWQHLFDCGVNCRIAREYGLSSIGHIRILQKVTRKPDNRGAGRSQRREREHLRLVRRMFLLGPYFLTACF